MTTATFGKSSYADDGANRNKNSNNSKDLFLRLKDGNNEVRIVTDPFQYLVHKYKKNPNDKKDFGEKVMCSQLHGSCAICEADGKAQQRWFYGVIDRVTGTYKLIDVSWAIYSKIKDFANNPKIGDPTKYDINILVKKNAPPNDYYNVQPLQREPLSATDQKIRDENVDEDDLKRRCTPFTVEKVQQKLDKIHGVTGAKAVNQLSDEDRSKSVTKSAGKSNQIPAVSMTDDEELEETFPDHDQASA